MASKKILDILREDATSLTQETGKQEGVAAVLLEGISPTSSRALFGQGLFIRYFPFSIGRMGNYRTRLREEPDLFLEDRPPYRISRLQLSIQRRGKELILVDRYSRYGSIIDDIPLGERRGRPGELSIAPGKHELLLGGTDSPFRFTLDVTDDHEVRGGEEQVTFGDRPVPVAALYSRLYRHVSGIFHQFFLDRPKSLDMADDLVETLHQYPEALDPLYHFSALPEIYGDVIVTHSLNVLIYTLKLAEMLPFARSNEERKRLALSALFHDIGMYDIAPEIVNKREKITAGEYEVIKLHPIQGQTWLLAVGSPPDDLLAGVALTHHERIDGQGYPRGIKDLSRYAELIAMVDFFEAVTHYRPQRGPCTPHEGMRMIIDLRRAIFSPPLLKQFIAGFSLYPVNSIVRLNSGEVGQVVKTDRDWPLRPTVRILFNRSGKAAPEGRNIDLVKESHIYIVRDISDRVFVDHYVRL